MLPAVIGSKRAGGILLMNETITAEQAVAWGLAHRIVPLAEIREQARLQAESIAQKKWGSTQCTKRLLWHDAGAVTERLEQERVRFCEQVVTAEAHAGMEAFLNKR